MSLQISTEVRFHHDRHAGGFLRVAGAGVEADFWFGPGFGNTQADAERQARQFAAATDMLAVAREVERLLTKQGWRAYGADPESQLLVLARSVIARVQGVA